jgi:hypothetical protein
LLQRGNEPVEQLSSDTQMSGVARDNDGDLSEPFIDEECVRCAERSTALLRDQPDRVRARLYVALDDLVVKVIDRVKETAIAILGARPLQNVIACPDLSVAASERRDGQLAK